MRGYTGEYFRGVPVYIREDYESAHYGESECERLGEILGASYDSLCGAMSAASREDERLLYHTQDPGYDIHLRGGRNPGDLWHPFNNGYVHEITGEYIETCVRPSYDSYPAWVTNDYNRSINHTEGVGLLGALTALATLLESLK